MNKYLAGGVVAAALALPVSAFGQNQDEIDALKAQVEELTRIVQELRDQQAKSNQAVEDVRAKQAESTQAVEAVQAKQAKSSWTDNVSFKGDLRYRFEGIDVEGVQGLENRDRQRIRARLMMHAKVNDTVSVDMELSTGGNLPRSRDVTLGQDGIGKEITFRQAYVTWKPTDIVAVTGGKIPQPWARNPVEYFYDSDYMPEGLALSVGGSSGFYGKGYWLYIDERLADDDSTVWGGEVGYTGSMFYASLGYQDFQNMKGYNPCFLGICNGNTIDDDRNLVYDYNITRVRGGVKIAGFDIFGEWAQNGDAVEDTAYAYGVVYGKAKEPGSWSIAALYQDMEKDALYAGMIDATFGAGRSAHDGYSIKGTYAIAKNWIGSFIWFDNSIEKLTSERDYNRYQLDLLYKF